MVSEFMLQQTQVETVLPYFERWMARFPDLASLAAADPSEVGKLWEGLGYYSRGRNLLEAARAMVGKGYNGPPEDRDELLRYPGFGPYTAGAVASIAGNREVAAVDGNVERLIARLRDVAEPAGSSALKRAATESVMRMMPKGRARAFNQALMELGALVCLPKNPRCGECPLEDDCLARRRGTETKRPLPKRRPATVKIDAWAVLWRHEGLCLLRRRPQEGPWARMWEIPWFPRATENATPDVEAHARELGLKCLSCEEMGTVRFSFTRHRVTAWFVVAAPTEIFSRAPLTVEKIEAGEWGLFAVQELSSLTLPAPSRKCLALMEDVFLMKASPR
jgi:A/G-specific adenine glycosylase